MADTTRYRGNHTHVAGGALTISGRSVVLTDAADPTVQAGAATAQTLTVDAGGVVVSSDLTVGGDLAITGAVATSPIITVAASDSADDAQNRADYVCDGTADEVQIQAALDALPAAGGTVRLCAGNYYVSTTTITMDEGQFLVGDGMAATIIQPHASTTLEAGEALITLKATATFDGGGLKDLHVMGDGGIDSTGDFSQPDGNATLYGVDFTEVTSAVSSWDMTRVMVTRCARGVNGETGNQRYIPVLDCVFWYNDMGFYCLEHPHFLGGDYRYNAVAIGGRPFDIKFTGCTFSKNLVGIERTGVITGVENANITGCIFFDHTTAAVTLGTGCNMNGCYIGTGSVACEKGIVVGGDGDCHIVGNRIAAQSTVTAGWTDGAVYFLKDTTRNYLTLIDANTFCNYIGPAIAAEVEADTAGYLRAINITNNTFRIHAATATVLSFGGYYSFGINFSNNIVAVVSNYNFGGASLLYIRNNTAGGNVISNNVFEFVHNTDCTNGYIFDGSLINTVFTGNHIRNADTFPVFTAAALASVNKQTFMRDNVGLGLTEHGAGAIGTAVAPVTYRTLANGTIITEITVDLTGLASIDTENDVVGLAAGGAAYLGRNVVANNGTIYKVEMACIEVPVGGAVDLILVAGSAADEAYNDTVADSAAIIDSAGNWTLGKVITNDAPNITANRYYYLTAGAATAGTYTAGQFVIRFYGHIALA